MVEAVQAVGNLVGGVAGYESGKYNRKANYAAAIAEEQDGADQEAAVRARAAQIIGAQVASQGENGFQQGSGSALDALAQSQVNATLDALTVRRKAAASAKSLRQKGDVALAAGKNAMVQGMFGAAASGINARTDWANARAGQTLPASTPAYGGGYAPALVSVRPIGAY